ncbi:metallophosphoesterase family protein [Bifidobacterium leontopitheci]|uniref:Uncharacterized protein n=1 Tax=Bifidobacterium leontopitheci TaxID=2650774 RepID=A0A6I1GGM6_9BIFI|nr:hypothetical protein [Bifidobacterium leontopitheci]KAB7790735.1 hypothetical protein F7D09_0841 [Bifidobacterium leontopitheci]
MEPSHTVDEIVYFPEPMTWDEFTEDILERYGDEFFEYNGRKLMIQYLPPWSIVDPTVLEKGTYPVLFSGSDWFREFLEQPMSVLDGLSIHEAYGRIRPFSN